MNIYILIGVPGSGKSTYVKNNTKENDIVLSSDEIRKELLNSEKDQTNNTLIFETLFARLAEVMKTKQSDIYIDATNIAKKERRIVLNTIKRYNKAKTEYIDGILYKQRDYKVIAINIEADLDTLVQRDALRERTVGEKVILRMLTRYVRPNREEGFDEIIQIDNRNINISDDCLEKLTYFMETWKGLEEVLQSNHWLQASLNCEQTSKFHQETLLEHLSMILGLVEKNASLDNIRIHRLLTIFHDIGKPYVRDTKKNNLLRRGYSYISGNRFQKKNGEDYIVENSEDFQFLWHENLGANMFRLLFKQILIEKNLISKDDTELIEIVIQGHLSFHQNEKTYIKIENKIYEDTTKVFKIWAEFSDYDGNGRIWLH